MRDQLDLAAIEKVGRGTKRPLQLAMMFSVAAITFAIVMGPIVFPTNDINQLYRGYKASWEQVKGVPPNVRDVQVDSRNTIWLLTDGGESITYGDGDTWETERDFGLGGVDLSAGMAVYQDQVWAAGGNSVVHFDGRFWQRFPGVLPESPKAIAVNDLGVFVFADSGRLTRLVDGTWVTEDMSQILPGVNEVECQICPLSIKLEAADSETILLQWKGLWRYNGDRWREIQIFETNLAYMDVAGVNSGWLWTGWRDGFTQTYLNGGSPDFVLFESLGLPEYTGINDISAVDDTWLLATDAGLLQSTGDSWVKLPLPEDRTLRVNHVTVSRQGEIWFTSTMTTSAPLAVIVVFVIPPILMAVAVIFFARAMLVSMNAQSRSSVALDSRLREVWSGLPPLPKSSWNAVEWVSLIATVMVIVAFGALLGGAMTSTGLLIALFTGGMLVYTSGYRKRLRHWPNALLHSLPVFLVVLPLMITMSSEAWATRIHPLLPGVLWIVCIIWLIAIGFLPIFSVLRMMHQGRYAEAERWSDQLIRWQPDSAGSIQMKALAQLNAGKLDESEALHRQLYAEMLHGNRTIKAALLNGLGLSVAYKGQFEEGLRLVACAVQSQPNSMPLYLSLAEIYLEAGVEAERALEVLDSGQRSSAVLAATVRCLLPAIRAWAFAQLGRFDEADPLLKRARAKLPKSSLITQAYLLYIEGHIHRLKGEREKAAEQFRQAVALDTGLYGQRAAKALAELDQSGDTLPIA